MSALKGMGPGQRVVVQDSLTVAHLQKSLTTAHLQQALGGAAPAPSGSTSTGSNTPSSGLSGQTAPQQTGTQGSK